MPSRMLHVSQKGDVPVIPIGRDEAEPKETTEAQGATEEGAVGNDPFIA